MKQHSLSPYPIEKASQEAKALEVLKTSSVDQNVLFDEGQYSDIFEDSDLKPVTKTIQKSNRNKRRYINTPNNIRLELIDAVHKHGEKIKYAAKRLGINYSSAKAICQVYKKEGRSDRIIVKRRESKQSLKELQQDVPILTTDFDKYCKEKSVNREEIYLKTLESLKEGSRSYLESQKILCNERTYMAAGKEIQDSFKSISYPAVLYQSLHEANQTSHRINQIINQNNIFITVQPDYFAQAQKLNAPPVKELLASGYHSIYTQNSNTKASFDSQSVQVHQQLMARIINQSMPQLNLNLPQLINSVNQPVIADMDRQFVQYYQDRVKQSNSYHLSSNLISAIQPQDYKLLNPTINKLPSSLDASLLPLSKLSPTLNGYMSNTAPDKMLYYPKK